MSSLKNIITSKYLTLPLLIAVLFLLNYFAGLSGIRFDLTKDQRYTLSDAAIRSTESFDSPLYIDIFLEGDLPSEFLKLRKETAQILREFQSENSHIKVNFIDPEEEGNEDTAQRLQAMGMQPAAVTIEEGSKVSQEMVYPWALVNYQQRTVKVALLKNTLGASLEERVSSSVQHLEYAFADAFTKVGMKDKKKIAVLKGNGELMDIEIADFLSALKDYYQIAPFTLDSANANAARTLEQLKEYDLTIIAKPTEAFSAEEKLVMDQYTLHGGKSLWLVDRVQMEMDSLYQNEGESVAVPRNLNLDDLFFKYGVRINPSLVSDLYFTQIVLATGSGSQTQYNPAPWLYHPMIFSEENHPVNTNIEALRMQFANPIDTLGNAINKTVLLRSSPLSKSVGAPALISLETVTREPDKESFNSGGMPLAVLLEGSFTSVFKNRLLPVSVNDYREQGDESAMIVISDGDLIRNDIQNGRPLELGYDKWTNNFYGNKEFLLNCVNYLLDDSGLINIRSKKVEIAFLDSQKAYLEKSKWQFINLGMPVLLSALFGFGFAFYRKRRYAR
ncbi:gliding motility-associated ABC transporter substrate-binding protein GldG [Robertkochia marina]|uniref:Gliding motility-associated ABC transporter substrate-binding protein GldG n=1 Tax=Robertkochia marina TaxID=1227945 RepID=A0A4S3LWT3_9FLAO|nr:gliding motility-associated ABC transporter substrate-binding protein GldG [Robertkochia marina]TRZ40850.1 gliding motility-associated ABC transporter substrate-binding protein GldG [Robertkochia marina]